jgi:hypothetical protein
LWDWIAGNWMAISGLGGFGAVLGFLPRLYRGIRALLAREVENEKLAVEIASLKRQAATREDYIEDLLESIGELQKRKDRAG